MKISPKYPDFPIFYALWGGLKFIETFSNFTSVLATIGTHMDKYSAFYKKKALNPDNLLNS